MTDALGDIIRRARIMGHLDIETNLTEDCGIVFQDEKARVRYHIIIDGEGWAAIDGAPTPIKLPAISLLIVPRGTRHTITGAVDTPAEDLVTFQRIQADNRRDQFEPGPAKTVASLVSGILEMDHDFGDVLIGELPSFIHLSLSERDELAWLADAVRFIAHDVPQSTSGGAAIADRLGEIIFIETIKEFAKTASSGIIASLRDPHIGAALNAFHRSPADDWTVTRLAQEAGLSRTVFAKRANILLGMTPMLYVRDWRLMLARRLLTTTDRLIETIAREVGYHSIGAFAKAYRDYYGVEPRHERAYPGRDDRPPENR